MSVMARCTSIDKQAQFVAIRWGRLAQDEAPDGASAPDTRNSSPCHMPETGAAGPSFASPHHRDLHRPALSAGNLTSAVDPADPSNSASVPALPGARTSSCASRLPESVPPSRMSSPKCVVPESWLEGSAYPLDGERIGIGGVVPGHVVQPVILNLEHLGGLLHVEALVQRQEERSSAPAVAPTHVAKGAGVSCNVAQIRASL